MNLRRTFLAQSGPPQSSQDGFLRTYALPADHPAFAGHFPGRPILPAVTQVLLAQLLIEAVMGTPVRLLAIPQAKFTAPIGPGSEFTVKVYSKDEGLWQCHLVEGERTAATFRMVVTPDAEHPAMPNGR